MSSIGIFWDYENTRPLSDTCIVDMSNRIRTYLLPHGNVVERNVYYDSQSTSEVKTNRTDLDMTGWSLIDCPKRAKKETLDKKIIVDMMFFVMREITQAKQACVCLISGDGDYCYVLNRIRDLGVKTLLFYPEKITYVPLIRCVTESFPWETEILSEKKDTNMVENPYATTNMRQRMSQFLTDYNTIQNKKQDIKDTKYVKDVKDVKYDIKDDVYEDNGSEKSTNSLPEKKSNDYEKMCARKRSMSDGDTFVMERREAETEERGESCEKDDKDDKDDECEQSSVPETDEEPVLDDPDHIGLLIFLEAVETALSKGKNSEKALDALVADIWYKRINYNSTINQETKEWYKSTRRKAQESRLIYINDVKENVSHVTRYISLLPQGLQFLTSQKHILMELNIPSS